MRTMECFLACTVGCLLSGSTWAVSIVDSDADISYNTRDTYTGDLYVVVQRGVDQMHKFDDYYSTANGDAGHDSADAIYTLHRTMTVDKVFLQLDHDPVQGGGAFEVRLFLNGDHVYTWQNAHVTDSGDVEWDLSADLAIADGDALKMEYWSWTHDDAFWHYEGPDVADCSYWYAHSAEAWHEARDEFEDIFLDIPLALGGVIPEPATLLVFSVAGLWLLSRRKRI